MVEIKQVWDNSNPDNRLKIVENQINTWLPYQYHNLDFIYQEFTNLPEAVRLWLIKYFN